MSYETKSEKKEEKKQEEEEVKEDFTIGEQLTWQYRESRTLDLAHFSSLNGWGKLGPEGSERVQACYEGARAVGEKFFLTLSPCKAFKYEFKQRADRGIVLARYLGKGESIEYTLCKPLRAPIVTCNVYQHHNQLEIQASTLGGQTLTHYFPMDCQWRDCLARVQKNVYTLRLFNDLELLRAEYYVGVTKLKLAVRMSTFLPVDQQPTPQQHGKGRGTGMKATDTAKGKGSVKTKGKTATGKGTNKTGLTMKDKGKVMKKPVMKNTPVMKKPVMKAPVMKKPAGKK